jgi:isopentenyldiphosphate isomerase
MNDSVTLVDLEDNPIGSISKLDAHLRSNLEGENKIGPHRAFSLILLNSNNEILL